MSSGMMTWDAQANVQMSTDDFTYQIMHSQVYDLGSGSPIVVNISGFDPSKCEAIVMPVTSATESDMDYARNALPYIVQTMGAVGISRQTPYGGSGTGESLLRFRLLVMRYRN